VSLAGLQAVAAVAAETAGFSPEMKGPHAYAQGTGRDAYGGGKLADDPRLLSVANIFRDPRSRVRRCVRRLDGALARHPESPESPRLWALSGVAVAQFLAGRGAPATLRARRTLSRGQPDDALESPSVLAIDDHLCARRDADVRL